MDKQIEISVYMTQYEVVKKYLDTYGILTPAILADMNLQIRNMYGLSRVKAKYLTKLKTLGYIVCTVGGGYQKIKEIPDYKTISCMLYGSEAPTRKKLRAVERQEAYSSLKDGYESLYGKKYKCSTLSFAIACGLRGTHLLAIEHLLGYVETGDKGCLEKVKTICKACLEVGETKAIWRNLRYMPKKFCDMNGFSDTIREIVEYISLSNWQFALEKVEAMCEQE